MKKNVPTAVKWSLTLLFTAALVVFVLYNIKHNDKFWEASAVNVITILIAVVISYFFVQKRNDRRKQMDILLELISRLQLQISSEKAYDFTGQTREEIMMRNRDINNKVQILTEVGESFLLKEDMKFVRQKTDEYLALIGDHSTDLDYLIKSKKELQRPLNLISCKLFSMSISLYK